MTIYFKFKRKRYFNNNVFLEQEIFVLERPLKDMYVYTVKKVWSFVVYMCLKATEMFYKEILKKKNRLKKLAPSVALWDERRGKNLYIVLFHSYNTFCIVLDKFLKITKKKKQCFYIPYFVQSELFIN